MSTSRDAATGLGRLAPDLGHTCRDYLGTYRASLDDAVKRGEGGVAVARRHARVVDGLVGALYCAADALARREGPPRGRLALVGVGGYGRGLVSLRGDIDLLVLCDDADDGAHAARVAAALLYPLWDLGVEVGHVVRTAEETVRLARDDLRTATTLLDLRRIAGDVELVESLQRAGRRAVFEPALGSFLDALAEDTRARHRRFGGSVYLLEPEVKLGRGGLRDFDVALWAARARFGGDGLEDLVKHGALLAREAKSLADAQEFQWRVRNHLHLRARRAHDRLTFEDQEDVAADLGFVDDMTLGVEQFMQTYYRHARDVTSLAERLLERSRPVLRRSSRRPPERLGDGTQVFDEHVTLEARDSLATDPAVALRLYRQVVRRALPPYPYARDAIARAASEASFRATLRGDPAAVALFLELLTAVPVAPVRDGSILGELHEVGLLTAMVPEFEPITGRVQHDLYHVYTTDVHSILSVERLHSLARGDLSAELPLATRLACDAPRPMPLHLALLVHDVGKAQGKNHAKRGAVIAAGLAARLGLAPVDVSHVEWLVAEHLTLYHAATRRDVTDVETLRELARLVGTPERLRDLYLVTICDLSTTSPSSLTAWKTRMLDELYANVLAELETGSSAAGESRASRLRAELTAKLDRDPDRDALLAFARAMPDRYVLATPVDTAVTHARLALARLDPRACVDDGVSMAIAAGSVGDSAEVVVAADDRPGLLADVCGVFAAHRLAVLSAQIYTRARDGLPDEAFDVFHVKRASRAGEPITQSDLDRVAADLRRCMRGETDVATLLARRAAPSWSVRKVPHVPTEVSVDTAASSAFTVVDVYTRDRLGLLHAIASALRSAGANIALSKINTEGARAADVFYVLDANGEKIDDAGRLRALRDALVAAIERFHEAAEGDAGGVT